MARRRSTVRRAGSGRRIAPGVIVGAVLLVAAIVAVGMRLGRDANSPVTQVGDDAAASAGRVATAPAREAETFFGRLAGMWDASARVEELERENHELERWRDLAERLAERNARYEALLRMPADAFGEGSDLENAIAAQLVLDSGGPFMRTLVANAGADHGVRVGFIAVNENGLVGRVVSAGRRSSRVLMLDDYSSRIPVMGEASRVRAVLAGQATRRPDLVTHPFQMQAPRLDFVVGVDNLREGERVITSGDGGLFPRGIPVGVAHGDRDGNWRVALAASQQPIDFVRLIPFVSVPLPETAPVEDPGPPSNTGAANAAIRREPMAPQPATSPPSSQAPSPARRDPAAVQPPTDAPTALQEEPSPEPAAAPPQ